MVPRGLGLAGAIILMGCGNANLTDPPDGVFTSALNGEDSGADGTSAGPISQERESLPQPGLQLAPPTRALIPSIASSHPRCAGAVGNLAPTGYCPLDYDTMGLVLNCLPDDEICRFEFEHALLHDASWAPWTKVFLEQVERRYLDLVYGRARFSMRVRSWSTDCVKMVNKVIYVGSDIGLSISHDRGKTFVTRTVEDGLASSHVRDVLITSTLILAATDRGLSISNDGGVTFHSVASLEGQDIEHITENNGIIYVVSQAGLSSSDNGGTAFLLVNNQPGWAHADLAGFEDVWVSGSILLAASEKGVAASMNRGRSIQLRTTNNGLPGGNVRTVSKVANRVFAGTDMGLAYSDNDTQTFATWTKDHGLPSNTVRRMAIERNIIAVVTDRSFALSYNAGPPFRTDHGLGDTVCTGVSLHNRELLVATRKGPAISDAPSSESEASSPDGGTDDTTPFRLTLANYAEGLAHNHITCIRPYGKSIYIGTLGGVSLTDNMGATFQTIVAGLGDPEISDLHIALDTVYASTKKGLGILKKNADAFINIGRSHGLIAEDVRGVTTVDDHILVTTFGGGVHASDDGGKSFVPKTLEHQGARLQATAIATLGKYVFAGTLDGILVSDNGGDSFDTVITTSDGLGSNVINGLYANDDGVYAATQNGVSRITLQGSKWRVHTTTLGLPSAEVHSVYAVGKHVLVATNKGGAISINNGTSFASVGLGHGLFSKDVTSFIRAGSTFIAGTAYGVGFLGMESEGGTSSPPTSCTRSSDTADCPDREVNQWSKSP